MREWQETIEFANGRLHAAATRDEAFDDPDGSWGTRAAPPPGEGWRVWYWWNDKHTVFGRIEVDEVAP
ncbi:hypothetical protein IB277_06755 [Ensifer sp. ENS07]|uniref:hypothetical protein n=1 Tax=Ensifer sp. ENS07 TaxID=2769274 RepID=UPI00177FE665|nr:hypothetical protein [Ensifer sp. ENS07]MBD9635992.1 hypothetical protein [Ensifer sp. ENS07]